MEMKSSLGIELTNLAAATSAIRGRDWWFRRSSALCGYPANEQARQTDRQRERERGNIYYYLLQVGSGQEGKKYSAAVRERDIKLV